MKAVGLKQWQHQRLVGLTPTDGTWFRPASDRPVAFCLNDFNDNCPVYQGYISNLLSLYDQIGAFTEVLAPADINAHHLWNYKQQQDHVTPDHYMPIKTTVKFNIQAMSSPTMSTIKLRFTVFKIKNIQNNVQKSLPGALGAYRNMCVNTPEVRNYFNTAEHHTILSDQWCTIKQTDATQVDHQRVVTVPIQFPAKVLKQELTTDPPGQSFTNNIAKEDQVWLLISSNYSYADVSPGPFSVYAERWNTWREKAGVGSECVTVGSLA